MIGPVSPSRRWRVCVVDDNDDDDGGGDDDVGDDVRGNGGGCVSEQQLSFVRLIKVMAVARPHESASESANRSVSGPWCTVMAVAGAASRAPLAAARDGRPCFGART